MKESRLRLLQDMPIFGGIQEPTLEFLRDSASIIKITKGDYFFHETDLGNAMYVLEKGRVEVLREWEGVQYKLRELNVGDCFGEMALMECCPRSASVHAVEDCQAIEITAAKFHEVYNKYPQEYILMYMNMGREVSRRLRQADGRLFTHDIEKRRLPKRGSAPATD